MSDADRTPEPGPVIEQPRLVLSPLDDGDASSVLAYRSEAGVSRYQSFRPGSLEEVIAFIHDATELPFGSPGRWSQLAIRGRDTATLIGDVGVHVQGHDPCQAEIGITVAPPFQGRGLGAEAVTGLLGHLFGTMSKHRVFASVDPRNEAAMALLPGVGMRKEAHFVQSYRFRGEWVDDVVFALLDSEWRRHHE